MKYLQIFVETDDGYKELDLYDARDFPLVLDYQIDDVDDAVKKKSSGSSTSFTIPVTKRNKEIFGNWGDGRTGDSNSVALKNAFIKDNGLPIGDGKIKLIDSDTVSSKTSRRAGSYEVTFLLDNAGWALGMQNMLIKDLPFTNWQFTWLNIAARFSDNTIDNGSVLIKWKEWTDVTAGNPAPNSVTPWEFTPHIYVSNLFEYAFNRVGYQIESTFFASDFWRNLIIPVPPKDYGEEYGEVYLNARAEVISETYTVALATLVTLNDTTGGGYDVGGYWDNTVSDYTAPLNSTYQIRLKMTVGNVVNQEARFQISIAGVNINLPIMPVGFSGDIEYFIETDLAPTDKVTLFLVQSGIGSPSAEVQGVTGYLEIIGKKTPIQENVWIDYSILIPKEWKVIDCISDHDVLHNLMFYADTGSKKIRIENRDRVFLLPDNTYFDGFYTSERLDWTSKRDLLPVGNETPKNDLKEVFRLEYQDDSNDGTAKLLQELNGKLQNADYQFPTGRYEGGTKSTKLKFYAKTIHLKDDSIKGQSVDFTVTPQIPVITKEDHNTGDISDNDYSQKPRLLFKRLANGLTDGKIYLNVSGSGAIDYLYPKAFAVNYDDVLGLDPNLSFGDETLLDGSTAKGMLYSFWLKKLATYRLGKIKKEFINLKASDLNGFDFSAKILLDGILYYLLKIDGYSPIVDSSTEVLLLTDMDAEEFYEDAITSNDTQSLIGNGE